MTIDLKVRSLMLVPVALLATFACSSFAIASEGDHQLIDQASYITGNGNTATQRMDQRIRRDSRGRGDSVKFQDGIQTTDIYGDRNISDQYGDQRNTPVRPERHNRRK